MAIPNVPFNVDDFRTPESTERTIRRILAAIPAAPPIPPTPKLPSLAAIAAAVRDQLQAPGAFPLNLVDLIPSSGAGTVIEDTHANRLLAPYTPPSTAGSLFFETDRTVFYVAVLSSGSLIWQYAAGAYLAALSAIPVDLGTADSGFRFIAVDKITEYEWTGTAWNTIGGLYQIIQNGTQNANTDIFILQHVLNNLAGQNGMAVGQLAQLVDSLKATVDGSRAETVITDATAATFTTKLVWQLRNAGAALADYFAVLVTDIRFKIGGFFGIFTHANSADRTYTLPDDTGTLVYDVTTLTANNIIIGSGTSKVTPLGTLGTTVTLLHGNAAGAPTFAAVSLTADVSGILPITNGGTGSAVGFSDGAVTLGVSFGGGTTGITYTAQTGQYRLMTTSTGSWVCVEGYFELSSKGSSTGTALLTGLPYIAQNTANQFIAVAISGFRLTTPATLGGLQGIVSPGGTTIAISFIDTGSGNTISLDDTYFNNNTEIGISVTYKIS